MKFINCFQKFVNEAMIPPPPPTSPPAIYQTAKPSSNLNIPKIGDLMDIDSSEIAKMKIQPSGIITMGKVKLKTSPENFYTRTMEWVQKNFNHPEKVIVGTVENKSIKINGIQKKAVSYNNPFGYHFDLDWEFYLEIEILYDVVTFKFTHVMVYDNGKPYPNLDLNGFFKKDIGGQGGTGAYNKAGQEAIPKLENIINFIVVEIEKTANSTLLSSEEAIKQLKYFKDKLDLGLITQEEYDAKKEELKKFIK